MGQTIHRRRPAQPRRKDDQRGRASGTGASARGPLRRPRPAGRAPARPGPVWIGPRRPARRSGGRLPPAVLGGSGDPRRPTAGRWSPRRRFNSSSRRPVGQGGHLHVRGRWSSLSTRPSPSRRRRQGVTPRCLQGLQLTCGRRPVEPPLGGVDDVRGQQVVERAPVPAARRSVLDTSSRGPPPGSTTSPRAAASLAPGRSTTTSVDQRRTSSARSQVVSPRRRRCPGSRTARRGSSRRSSSACRVYDRPPAVDLDAAGLEPLDVADGRLDHGVPVLGRGDGRVPIFCHGWPLTTSSTRSSASSWRTLTAVTRWPTWGDRTCPTAQSRHAERRYRTSSSVRSPPAPWSSAARAHGGQPHLSLSRTVQPSPGLDRPRGPQAEGPATLRRHRPATAGPAAERGQAPGLHVGQRLGPGRQPPPPGHHRDQQRPPGAASSWRPEVVAVVAAPTCLRPGSVTLPSASFIWAPHVLHQLVDRPPAQASAWCRAGCRRRTRRSGPRRPAARRCGARRGRRTPGSGRRRARRRRGRRAPTARRKSPESSRTPETGCPPPPARGPPRRRAGHRARCRTCRSAGPRRWGTRA